MKMSQFWPKSKAIALVVWPKSKAIALVFWPKMTEIEID